MIPRTNTNNRTRSIFRSAIGLFAFGLMAAFQVGCDSGSIGLFGPVVTSTETPSVNPESYALIGVREMMAMSKIGLIANDIDADSVMPYSGETDQGGIIELSADGSFSYVAPDKFYGTDYFEYVVEMGDLQIVGVAAFKVYPPEATPVP